ncbi:MAG TPA: N-acetyltransferase [Thermoplasmata archaeon]|nr:N-acetyltransferase [Thermoplasmata archaeon]
MIRAADVHDLDALFELEDLCFAERKFRKEHLLWILKNPRASTYVYENGGLIGAVILLTEPRRMRVISVGVHPRHRRRGVGRDLMAAAEDVARRLRADEVRLEVNTSNAGAIAFYRELGYELLERLPAYYSWGADAYSMAKPIAPLIRKS